MSKSDKPIYNEDSTRLAEAVAHKNPKSVEIAQDIWKKHQGDADGGTGYWNGVRAGANNIVEEASKADSRVAKGTIEHDGSIKFEPAVKTNKAGNTELGDQAARKSGIAPVWEAIDEAQK